MKDFNRKIINKLLESEEFTNSRVDSRLLEYLYHCYHKDITPHEYEIAINVLNKNKEFDPTTDSIARVYLSKLRKKLETYYKTKGKDDPIKLVLPKRCYKIKFVHDGDMQAFRGIKLKKNMTLPLMGALVFIIITLFIYTIKHKNQAHYISQPPNADFLWNSFTKSELPTVIAFGHLFTFSEYNKKTDIYRIIRDFYINSEDDFKAYLNIFDIDPANVYKTNWEIVPLSALLNFSKILPLFLHASKPVDLTVASHLVWDDINSKNIIYIGHFHNMGILTKIFPQNHFYSPAMDLNYLKLKNYLNEHQTLLVDTSFSSKPMTSSEKVVLSKLRRVYVIQDSSKTFYNTIQKWDSGHNKDYVIVSKTPGPDQNTFLFIISSKRIGREKIIEMLTNQDLAVQLKNKILARVDPIPCYFQMLIEVEGFRDTGLRFELKHFFQFKGDFQVYK